MFKKFSALKTDKMFSQSEEVNFFSEMQKNTNVFDHGYFMQTAVFFNQVS